MDRGIRQDADLVNLKQLLDYMQECEFWPTQLSDDSSTFKKLLMIENLFGAENKTIRSPKFIKMSKGRKR